MGLFSDFYNTVAKFFRPQEEPMMGDASKAVATNRLKLVLMQDRTNLTPKVLEQMRGELVDLLSKYLEMDKEMLELNFEQEGDQVALMLSIPVIRAKDEAEIEEALKASEENKSLEDNENSDDDSEEEFEDDNGCDNSDDDTEDEIEEETENCEGITEDVKPKRKRKKKVSTPDDMQSNNADIAEETNVQETAEAVIEE